LDEWPYNGAVAPEPYTHSVSSLFIPCRPLVLRMESMPLTC
jgi:hypothetical protein